MKVDCPKLARLFCPVEQVYHNFLLDEDIAAYVPAAEQLIPESMLSLDRRCIKIIDVRTLLVQYSSQVNHGVTELMLPIGDF